MVDKAPEQRERHIGNGEDRCYGRTACVGCGLISGRAGRQVSALLRWRVIRRHEKHAVVPVRRGHSFIACCRLLPFVAFSSHFRNEMNRLQPPAA